GYERYVAELHIPPTEIVYDGFVVPDYKRDRMDRGKTRFEQCATCRFEPMCEGPWREYPEHLGSDEFQAVAGPRVFDTAIVLGEGFALLGRAAPGLGDFQSAARWVAVVFYPEAFSPDCTTQWCNLQSGRSLLDAAGIAVVGVSRDTPERRAAFARDYGLSAT